MMAIAAEAPVELISVERQARRISSTRINQIVIIVPPSPFTFAHLSLSDRESPFKLVERLYHRPLHIQRLAAVIQVTTVTTISYDERDCWTLSET